MGWAVVCWGWNLVLCYQCMVERTRKQLKYTYLHPFVNRQSKNSLADVVLLIQIEIMVALQTAIWTFLGFANEADFLVQSNGWSYSFLRKFSIINEAPLLCYISFKKRQSFFDTKGFLKNLLHIMDFCSQVVVKEVLLITMLTIKTYLQLITIRSKDYLQFISIKHSFQLIITIKITMIMIILIIIIIIIIISCYSNGYIGDLPGVFSVWYFPRHILALS